MVKLISSILAVCVSIARSRTSDCNYVVNLFSFDANPPSKAPTASPTNSPTGSPTQAPTNTGEIKPTPTYYDVIDVGGSSEDSVPFSPFEFRPHIPSGYCYSSALNEEPFNSISYKYECVDESSLKRTMYYDNLDCTGSDKEETTFTSTDQGTAIIFNCGASINCDAASITTEYATTMVSNYILSQYIFVHVTL